MIRQTIRKTTLLTIAARVPAARVPAARVPAARVLAAAALCAAVLCVAATPASAKKPRAGAIPRAMLRKVYFSKPAIKNSELSRLIARFSTAKPRAELVRDKRKEWKVHIVAFFGKKSFPGPVTIWLYDKADKASLRAKEPVHVLSVNAEPTQTFVHELFLDANVGFNKNHTFLVQVGQLISKRARVYAQGEVKLLP